MSGSVLISAPILHSATLSWQGWSSRESGVTREILQMRADFPINNPCDCFVESSSRSDALMIDTHTEPFDAVGIQIIAMLFNHVSRSCLCSLRPFQLLVQTKMLQMESFTASENFVSAPCKQDAAVNRVPLQVSKTPFFLCICASRGFLAMEFQIECCQKLRASTPFV